MTTIADIVRPLALTGRLLSRFWPQLLLIGAVGYIARDLLLGAAVTDVACFPAVTFPPEPRILEA